MRADLRKEIEAEIRAEVTNRAASPSERPAHTLHSATAAHGRLGAWLASHMERPKINFTRKEATFAYRPSPGPTRTSAAESHSQTTDAPHKHHQRHYERHHRLEQGATNEPPVSTPLGHKPTAAKEPRITLDNVENLIAAELIRRHSGCQFGETLSRSELKSAWRKAALKTHPDRFCQADPTTQARMNLVFSELTKAYDQLLALFKKESPLSASERAQ